MDAPTTGVSERTVGQVRHGGGVRHQISVGVVVADLVETRVAQLQERETPTLRQDDRGRADGAAPPADAATPRSPPAWRHPTVPARRPSRVDGRRSDTAVVAPR